MERFLVFFYLNTFGCSRGNQANKTLYEYESLFSVNFPPSPTRISTNSGQRSFTIGLILTNARWLEDKAVLIALSFDQLSVLFEVKLDVRREVSERVF
jgi:hypothetical protein